MRRALFLAGGWEGHQPLESCKTVAEALARRGFETEVAISLDALLDQAKMQELDLIVPCFTMSKISDPQLSALDKAIAAGCGLGGWHGGMGDAFRECTQYQFMTGGQWVAHPGNETKQYRVRILDSRHPITAGVSSFDFVSEQYYMHTDPGNQVLATTTFDGSIHPWIEGTVMPVVWTRSWGQGRVFYSSLGHQAAEFATPEVLQITVNGLEWAARRGAR